MPVLMLFFLYLLLKGTIFNQAAGDRCSSVKKAPAACMLLLCSPGAGIIVGFLAQRSAVLERRHKDFMLKQGQLLFVRIYRDIYRALALNIGFGYFKTGFCRAAHRPQQSPSGISWVYIW